MKKLTDKEWLRVFNQFFDQCFKVELKNGLSTKEAMELAFQKTVDLEYHPDFPVSLPINQRVLDEWGEKHQNMLADNIHIAIINSTPQSTEVGIIKVKREWLRCDFPQWLIDNGHYDYFYEISDDEMELIEFFLYVYCDYSQNNLLWQCVPEDTQLKRKTIKDYQK